MAESTPACAATPVQCRGIELLGMTYSGTAPPHSVCVHQLAVELWRRYDTPRAAVQKKIARLNIKLECCNREQVYLLRRHGIIDNFRATSVRLRDAELLFDALETSRKKRGLEKHKLKTADRNMRKEEVKIRKLFLKRKLIGASASGHADVSVSGASALNRDVALDSKGVTGDAGTSSAREETDKDLCQKESSIIESGTLLVTEDAFKLPGFAKWKICTKHVANASFVTNSRVELQRMNGRREDQLPTADSEREYLAMLKEHSYAKQSVQSLQSSRCTSSLGYATDSTELLPIECPVSRIRSPSCISSDLEDQGSHHYITSSGRSHSGGTTPNKSSPERFLLIDSDNESDFEGTAPIHNSNQNNCSSTQCSLHCSQYRGVPHRGKQLAGGVVGCEGRRRVYSSSSVDESGGAADVLPAFGALACYTALVCCSSVSHGVSFHADRVIVNPLSREVLLLCKAYTVSISSTNCTNQINPCTLIL